MWGSGVVSNDWMLLSLLFNGVLQAGTLRTVFVRLFNDISQQRIEWSGSNNAHQRKEQTVTYSRRVKFTLLASQFEVSLYVAHVNNEEEKFYPHVLLFLLFPCVGIALLPPSVPPETDAILFRSNFPTPFPSTVCRSSLTASAAAAARFFPLSIFASAPFAYANGDILNPNTRGMYFSEGL